MVSVDKLNLPRSKITDLKANVHRRATGNTARPVTRDLMNRLGEAQNSRRGLLVDEHLRVEGAEGIFALGDCTGDS